MTFLKGEPAWNSGKRGVQEPWNKGKRSKPLKPKGTHGGYRPGSGVGKSGWYKDIWCDSTWELAFVIWCHNNGKNVKKNTERFKYSFEGKQRTYLPDFLVDGELIEIKGRRTTDALIDAKLASTGGRVKIFLHNDMQEILASVNHLQPLERLYE